MGSKDDIKRLIVQEILHISIGEYIEVTTNVINNDIVTGLYI
jgi:hypothetical protein